MSLPPKGDPRRPLHLAARLSAGLAVLCLALGVSILFLTLIEAPFLPALLGEFVCLLVPGMIYLLGAIYIREKQLSVIVLCMSVAALHGLVCAMILFSALMSLIYNRGRMSPGVLALLISGALLTVLTEFMSQLIRSWAALRKIRELETGRPAARGFSPILAQTIPVKVELSPEDNANDSPQKGGHDGSASER